MEAKSDKLFVYGSLRKGFHSPAYRYISDYFQFVGPARVRGKLFDLGESPAAIPALDDYFITGELYQLNHPAEFGWAIAQLDDYEGVDPEVGEIPLYRRDLAHIFCNGYTTEAWIYWYCGDTTGHPRIESGDVLEYLRSKNS